MKHLAVILGLLATATSIEAGNIVGSVRAEAPPELDGEGSDGGKYDSRRLKFAERIDYSQLREFIVFIDQAVTNSPPPPAEPLRIVTQKDALFKPHVLPVMVGTTIEWPNEDKIFHNVFSMSEGNDFNLGLYKQPGTNGWPSVTFKKSGRVDVFCSIHTKMNCVILVVENPYFAATDSKGRYVVKDVPPGTYKLKAWHERLPPQVKHVTVLPNGEVKVDFVLGPAPIPKN